MCINAQFYFKSFYRDFNKSILNEFYIIVPSARKASFRNTFLTLKFFIDLLSYFVKKVKGFLTYTNII